MTMNDTRERVRSALLQAADRVRFGESPEHMLLRLFAGFDTELAATLVDKDQAAIDAREREQARFVEAVWEHPDRGCNESTLEFLRSHYRVPDHVLMRALPDSEEAPANGFLVLAHVNVEPEFWIAADDDTANLLSAVETAVLDAIDNFGRSEMLCDSVGSDLAPSCSWTEAVEADDGAYRRIMDGRLLTVDQVRAHHAHVSTMRYVAAANRRGPYYNREVLWPDELADLEEDA